MAEALAAAVVAGVAPVASPCVSICQMDERSGLCCGCARTLDEIACWGQLDNPGRQAVLERVRGRLQAMKGRTP